MEISKERLAELEDVEEKMNCLEAGGVDNWEFFGLSLKKYWEKKDRAELLKTKYTELLEILCGGIIQPAGSGCGFGFADNVLEEGERLFIKTIEGLSKEAVK